MSSMKDVARLAGVSLMTVSRVVNQSAPVDETTRAKVEDAIRKLRFRPNLFAKRLRQRHAEPNDTPHSLYAVYECYRECAKAGEPYTNSPGKGKRLGFASVFSAEPFGVEVEENICRQAELAGFERQDLILLDNKYDADIALKNAELMLAQELDLFIEYQADVKANHIIAAKFAEAEIPIIAVDIPVPGAPFMGVHDWQAATLGGKYMAQLITEKWGGWEAVDIVVLLQMPAGGEITMLRSEGFATALEETFGSQAEQKIVRADGGMGLAEQAKTAMYRVLAAHPNAKRIALTSINEETMSGAIEALQEAGRWQRENLIIITLGVDDLGKKQIREGLSDAGVAFFPEKYGEYLIPAACAILEGAPVPSHIFVENEIITRQNIDQFYPQR
ncbi:regulatory protein IclR [Candidatus Moduliflexus flocculans]|uniref:Regulatory protein IclR n=1 Tax=Candidatus Moduliflexus flocculans TaxID=1499966 RepID=A0A0S6VR34_9BACT|nr:regulatory protein IclR [Candidatus Moduliflexus flocculans]